MRVERVGQSHSACFRDLWSSIVRLTTLYPSYHFLHSLDTRTIHRGPYREAGEPAVPVAERRRAPPDPSRGPSARLSPVRQDTLHTHTHTHTNTHALRGLRTPLRTAHAVAHSNMAPRPRGVASAVTQCGAVPAPSASPACRALSHPPMLRASLPLGAHSHPSPAPAPLASQPSAPLPHRRHTRSHTLVALRAGAVPTADATSLSHAISVPSSTWHRVPMGWPPSDRQRRSGRPSGGTARRRRRPPVTSADMRGYLHATAVTCHGRYIPRPVDHDHQPSL